MQIVLLSQDLMIGAHVEGATRQLGMTLQQVPKQQAAVAAATDTACQVLLVDLSTPELDLAALVQALRSARGRSLPIVASGPHVHEARLEAARAAGCEVVISRGQLDRELSTILTALTHAE